MRGNGALLTIGAYSSIRPRNSRRLTSLRSGSRTSAAAASSLAPFLSSAPPIPKSSSFAPSPPKSRLPSSASGSAAMVMSMSGSVSREVSRAVSVAVEGAGKEDVDGGEAMVEGGKDGVDVLRSGARGWEVEGRIAGRSKEVCTWVLEDNPTDVEVEGFSRGSCCVAELFDRLFWQRHVDSEGGRGEKQAARRSRSVGFTSWRGLQRASLSCVV